MINILVAPTDHYACDKYRCSEPHLKLQELYPDEFKVTINYDVDWTNILNCDILQLHAGIYKNEGELLSALNEIKGKTKIIVDIDDYWVLPKEHEAYIGLKSLKYDEHVTNLLKIADYVTASTANLATYVKEYNPNVYVIPNAVDFSKDWTYKNKSDKVRFGIVGSRSHYHDYLQLKDVTSSLPEEILNKCQFILCGFQEVGCHILRNGKLIKTDAVAPDMNWALYEKILTGDYKILDSEYAKLLKTYGNHQEIDKYIYKRMYQKDISEYLNFYRDIDVLMAPLMICEFNNCKSNLKFLEAGQTKTAVIATNTGPFKEGIDLRNNSDGNCILVEPTKESWIEAITTFIKHPELIELSKKNISSFIKERYDLKNVTKYRAKLYKQWIN